MTLEPAVAWILDRFRAGKTWLAIDGLGASGKSSLAAAVAAADRRVEVISLDDFTRPGAVGWERDRFREQVWLPLHHGRPARYQRWHWTDAEPGEWVELGLPEHLLIEGIGASEPPEAVQWDALVWLAAPAAQRLARAESRDPGRFGCWSQTWRPIEDEWFARTQPWRRAGLVWVNA